jgi:hypothetical protein
LLNGLRRLQPQHVFCEVISEIFITVLPFLPKIVPIMDTIDMSLHLKYQIQT